MAMYLEHVFPSPLSASPCGLATCSTPMKGLGSSFTAWKVMYEVNLTVLNFHLSSMAYANSHFFPDVTEEKESHQGTRPCIWE